MIEGRISLRFPNESNALGAAMALGAALGAANVEVLSVDLVRVEVAASDEQP